MLLNKLLLIDTTTAVSSIALYADDTIVGIFHHEEAKEQAAKINIIIHQLLQDAGWHISELTGIGICSGPGSYTGMRIGYSVAKGICYGLSIPFYTVNKFEVLALSLHEFPALIALKARVGEYFLSALSAPNTWLIEPKHHTEEELMDLLEVHKIHHVLVDEFTVNDGELNGVEVITYNSLNTLDMKALGDLIKEKQSKCITDDIAYAEPLYLKSVYTTASKKKSLF